MSPEGERNKTEDLDPEFETLLGFLKDSRGFDFTGYKRASIRRRVDKRMQEIGVGTYGEYLDELQATPEEFPALFNFILINVTGFFRDPQIWSYIASDIVPSIVSHRGPAQEIRAWSAGCASGEEAYSIAILLCDALGEEAFTKRVKIYGHYVEEEALPRAPLALSSAKSIGGVPAAMRSKYFEQIGPSFAFSKNLRRSMI